MFCPRQNQICPGQKIFVWADDTSIIFKEEVYKFCTVLLCLCDVLLTYARTDFFEKLYILLILTLFYSDFYGYVVTWGRDDSVPIE